MKIVGLTGGIGSGKSTVAQWFADKGVPVYNSDMEAKRLMNENPGVRSKIIALLGKESYEDTQLNRKFISSKVFNDKELLEQLNMIVHPAVFEDFTDWVHKQTSSFVIKEAAILFESGAYNGCDYIISVVADEELRIQRVMQRDDISREAVLERIQNQWTDELRIVNSDFIIKNNSTLEELREEFEEEYNKLLKKIKSS